MVLSSSFRGARIIDKVIARCGTEIRTIERLHRPTGYNSLMLLFCLWKWAPFLTLASNGGALIVRFIKGHEKSLMGFEDLVSGLVETVGKY